MKKNALLLIGLIGLFTLISCDKDKDSDYFTFEGTEYRIDNVELVEEVFNDGDVNEKSVFQFMFESITDGDTTTLLIALLDQNTNTLGGNYPAIDQAASSVSRAIFPFGLLFISGLTFQDETSYLTGEGGSIDVSVSGSTYSVTFNNISMGEYDDLFDMDENEDCEYYEIGRIGGHFKGNITKETTVITKSGSSGNTALDKLIQKIQ